MIMQNNRVRVQSPRLVRMKESDFNQAPFLFDEKHLIFYLKMLNVFGQTIEPFL